MDAFLSPHGRYRCCTCSVPGFGVPPRIGGTITSLLRVHRYTCDGFNVVSKIPNAIITSSSTSLLSSSISAASSSSLNTLNQIGIDTISRAFTSISDFDNTSDNVKNEISPEFPIDEKELLDQHEFKGKSSLNIAYFKKLQEKGLCKKIAETFCQDNRDDQNYGILINEEKNVLLNQTLDTELIFTSRRKPVYWAVKNGEILAENVRRWKRKSDIKEGEKDPLPNGKILERVVRVLKKTEMNRYDRVHLNLLQQRVGVAILATFDRNRPPGTTVEHINGRRDDDRLQNLRWATHKVQNIDGKLKSRSSWFEPLEPNGEAGFKYYIHPNFRHISFSENTGFPILCWNNVTESFVRIYHREEFILMNTIEIDGKEYKLKKLIQEAYEFDTTLY